MLVKIIGAIIVIGLMILMWMDDTRMPGRIPKIRRNRGG
jgi:hypothetical protein